MSLKYKDKLLELKRLLKRFIDKDYFKTYHPEDFFYFMDPKSKGILFFCDKIFNDSFGMQIFFNKDGFNFLHDALTTTDAFSINHFFSTAYLICITQKNSLTEEDIKFLHLHKINVCKQNYIPYGFKEGYGLDYLKLKELDMVLRYLYYLESLLLNEKNDVDEAFQNEQMPISFFDPEKLVYEVHYGGLMHLETFPPKKNINFDFVKDNQHISINEDTYYFFHTYFKAVEPENEEPYDSILMIYSLTKKTYEYQVIKCKPKEVVEYVYAFLDDYFKSHGIPSYLVCNHRKIYSWVYKTLRELNINLSFKREVDIVDEKLCELMGSLLEQIYDKELYETKKYIS